MPDLALQDHLTRIFRPFRTYSATFFAVAWDKAAPSQTDPYQILWRDLIRFKGRDGKLQFDPEQVAAEISDPLRSPGAPLADSSFEELQYAQLYSQRLVATFNANGYLDQGRVPLAPPFSTIAVKLDEALSGNTFSVPQPKFAFSAPLEPLAGFSLETSPPPEMFVSNPFALPSPGKEQAQVSGTPSPVDSAIANPFDLPAQLSRSESSSDSAPAQFFTGNRRKVFPRTKK